MDKKEVVYMPTTAQKWGGSIGVRIPQRIAKKFGIVNGTQLQVSEDGENILIKPVENEITLEELLAQCTGDNPHQEFFSDTAGMEEL